MPRSAAWPLAGAPAARVSIHRPSLDDVFLSFTNTSNHPEFLVHSESKEIA